MSLTYQKDITHQKKMKEKQKRCISWKQGIVSTGKRFNEFQGKYIRETDICLIPE